MIGFISVLRCFISYGVSLFCLLAFIVPVGLLIMLLCSICLWRGRCDERRFACSFTSIAVRLCSSCYTSISEESFYNR